MSTSIWKNLTAGSRQKAPRHIMMPCCCCCFFGGGGTVLKSSSWRQPLLISFIQLAIRSSYDMPRFAPSLFQYIIESLRCNGLWFTRHTVYNPLTPSNRDVSSEDAKDVYSRGGLYRIWLCHISSTRALVGGLTKCQLAPWWIRLLTVKRHVTCSLLLPATTSRAAINEQHRCFVCSSWNCETPLIKGTAQNRRLN